MPDKATYIGKERRKHLRLKLDTIINITRKDESYFFDFSLNISEYGFLFETKETFIESECIHFLFPLPMETWIFAGTAQMIWKRTENMGAVGGPITQAYGFKILNFEKKEDQENIKTYFKNPPDLKQLDEVI